MAVVADPLAADAVVMIDTDTRTLAVKPAQSRGYAAYLWRRGVRSLAAVNSVSGLDVRRHHIAWGFPRVEVCGFGFRLVIRLLGRW